MLIRIKLQNFSEEIELEAGSRKTSSRLKQWLSSGIRKVLRTLRPIQGAYSQLPDSYYMGYEKVDYGTTFDK